MRSFALVCLLAVALASKAPTHTTVAPTTDAPTTVAPTSSPTTASPTAVPSTVTPTTSSPTREPTTTAPSSEPTTPMPTTAPTTATPTTSAPTITPTTAMPTVTPTTGTPTGPTTKAPTAAPTTASPTETPTTGAPTAPTAPTTRAPTADVCGAAIWSMVKGTYINPTVSFAMLTATADSLNAIGDYEGCMHMCDEPKRNCTGNVATHCTLSLGGLVQGVCVPTIPCSEANLQALVTGGVPLPKNMSLKGVTVHCGSYAQESWNAGSIVMIVILVLLAGLMIAGTLVDLELIASAQKNKDKLMEDKSAASVDSTDSLLPRAKDEVSTGKQLLLCFSVMRSMTSVLERSPTRKYKALDGIRVMSLMWIILGHTINFWLFIGISNPSQFFPPGGDTAKTSFSVMIFGANNAVDTFFFLSAFLATLVMVRRLEKGASVPIIGSAVHRFLRLSPTYLFVIMTYMALGPYVGEGPFWFNMKAVNTEPCERYWWTNLLYINNFHPKVYADQCVPWTWYLANDMQFFVIGTAITVLFHKNFKLVVGVLCTLMVASLVITGVIVAENEVQAFSLTHPDVYQNDVYDKPYTRITSYLIGMFVAFLFTKTSVRIKGPRWVALCVVLMLVCTFVPCYVFHEEFYPTLSSWNVTQNVLYITFSRPMWTTGVALLTYLCICDVGGPIDWFLSLAIWDPLAKLSYCAYLVHPIIMRVFYFNRRQLFFWSVWEYTSYFVANLFISYAVAAVVYCAVECPFASLEKVVGDLGKKRGKRRH